LAALVSGLAPWINQSSYPIAITSTQRSALTALFQATQTAETVLVNKIDSVNSANALTSANSNTTTQIGYVNSSIDNINTTLSSAGQSLATLNNDLVALSSATELTLAEAKALAYDLSQAQAQLGTTGDTLYTIAQSLGITTQLTNYSNAVAALALGLAPWVEI
jgi:chromosome segregation ATPase